MVVPRRVVRRRPPRRRVILMNRIEDRSPGRLAFVIHRGRGRSRAGSASLHELLARWLDDRRAQLEAEDPDQRGEPDAGGGVAERTPGDDAVHGTPADASAVEGDGVRDDASEDEPAEGADGPDRFVAATEPSDDWTKGQLYERARELDISGRSKMNKAELLEAVRTAGEGDGPADG